MRFKVDSAWMLIAIAALSVGPRIAWAQAEAATNQAARPELALDYSYVRSNAPPGECTCFNQNGGSAAFSLPLKNPQFALVADVTAAHAGGIASGSYGLTMSTYLAGMQYVPMRQRRTAIQPFGHVLVGLAHASGSLVNGPDTNVANAGAAFASMLGGGVDWRLNGRWSIRLAEADYLLTTFDNGANNHQNNLRIAAGLVVRFGRE
jgi:peptidoglycan-associated lipoprotein